MLRPAHLPSTPELQQRLADQLGLTYEDIVANQQGRLSPAQQTFFRAMLPQFYRRSPYFFVVVVVLALLDAALQFRDYGAGALMRIGVRLVIFVAIAGVALLRNPSLAHLKVKCVSGIVYFNPPPYLWRFPTTIKITGVPVRVTQLQVDKQKILMAHSQAEQAFVAGAPYQIYYTMFHNQAFFVSAEAAEP